MFNLVGFYDYYFTGASNGSSDKGFTNRSVVHKPAGTLDLIRRRDTCLNSRIRCLDKSFVVDDEVELVKDVERTQVTGTPKYKYVRSGYQKIFVRKQFIIRYSTEYTKTL